MLVWGQTLSYIVLCLLDLVLRASAYIPARPTNTTSAIGGENLSSWLHLVWFPNASYTEMVSYRLVGEYSTGANKGALVHFSELHLTNQTTTTNWIALIACDANATDAPLDVDIFTLARDRGAVAALLYSEWSQSCLINEEYADPENFDQVFDIYSTNMLASTRTVTNAFDHVNNTLYNAFDPVVLNQSALAINDSMQSGRVSAPGYLFATLSVPSLSTPSNNSASSEPTPTSATTTTSNNTDLAMIVLYVITGAVSFLFCIVILSGAIRAIRHPERYGPRPADPTLGEFGSGQSRARGLTRAILDTFPVIKFSTQPQGGGDPRYPSNSTKLADLESRTNDSPVGFVARGIYPNTLREGDVSVQGNDGRIVEVPRRVSTEAVNEDVLRDAILAEERLQRPPASSLDPASSPQRAQESGTSTVALTEATAVPRPRKQNTEEGQSRDSMMHPNIVPEAIGRDTCPICIVDFEEGDDIRILPCEGRHAFHQACVDPWLLELSSSCPICRQDFHALEEMIAGSTDDHDDQHDTTENRASNSHTGARYRFSRYLRFARGRRGRHGQGHGHWGHRDSIAEDPTDPPAPIVADTRL